MTVVRDGSGTDLGMGHFAAAALLCGVACTALVLKGFKASLNMGTSRNSLDQDDQPPGSPVGVYRPFRDDIFISGPAQTHKTINPSAVKLLPSKPIITKTEPAKPNKLQEKPSEVSYNPNGPSHSIEINTIAKFNPKEQKKLAKELQKEEEKRIKEQRKKDKAFIAVVIKEDSEKIEREHALYKERLRLEKESKSKKKSEPKAVKATPKAAAAVIANPLAAPSNPLATQKAVTTENRSDTLLSSISKSSGPPPYSEQPAPNTNDNTGNTSFGKPLDNFGSSWDMVSQHRQQMNRPANPVAVSKGQKLEYTVGKLNLNEGSSRPSNSVV